MLCKYLVYKLTKSQFVTLVTPVLFRPNQTTGSWKTSTKDSPSTTHADRETTFNWETTPYWETTRDDRETTDSWETTTWADRDSTGSWETTHVDREPTDSW